MRARHESLRELGNRKACGTPSRQVSDSTKRIAGCVPSLLLVLFCETVVHGSIDLACTFSAHPNRWLCEKSVMNLTVTGTGIPVC